MLGRLIVLFITVPLLDLLLLIALGRYIGYLETVFIVIGIGIIGAIIAEREGLYTFRRVRDEFYKGNLPTDELMDGVFVLVGGVMLITPGLITDVIGILCLIPQSRRYIKRFTLTYLKYLLNSRIFRIKLRR
ncbi:MAG: FxsA family protein [Thermoanaerobacteraceae bacterium]|nr:FxsA family protein [Thermoanaerobacteraceae bacterium]